MCVSVWVDELDGPQDAAGVGGEGACVCLCVCVYVSVCEWLSDLKTQLVSVVKVCVYVCVVYVCVCV